MSVTGLRITDVIQRMKFDNFHASGFNNIERLWRQGFLNRGVDGRTAEAWMSVAIAGLTFYCLPAFAKDQGDDDQCRSGISPPDVPDSVCDQSKQRDH